MTTQITASEQVDAALDEILRVRAAATAQPVSVERSLLLAELADVEAAWWEELSERCRTRVYWRAALTAREHARHTARHWREQATAQATAAPCSEQGSGEV
ncbi:MAG: hypothetical protein ABR608_14950 [Pseudonocardiaceae bacterium]